MGDFLGGYAEADKCSAVFVRKRKLTMFSFNGGGLGSRSRIGSSNWNQQTGPYHSQMERYVSDFPLRMGPEQFAELKFCPQYCIVHAATLDS